MDLINKAHELRKTVMDVCYKTQSGHPTSALSCIEILTVLFYGNIMRYDSKDICNKDRDRFILSKGHACVLQYAIFADLGIVKYEDLYRFCKIDSNLGGHINMLNIPGTDFSAGSLGHGFSYAVGQALNFKFLDKKNEVFVLLGDGECEEGSIWEAAWFASVKKLDNLTVIIDENKLQSSGFVQEISGMNPMDDKWKAFGFHVIRVDGHDIESLKKAFEIKSEGRPKVIIADTVKGKGISFMENQNHWHAKRPNEQQWEVIKKELGIED